MFKPKIQPSTILVSTLFLLADNRLDKECMHEFLLALFDCHWDTDLVNKYVLCSAELTKEIIEKIIDENIYLKSTYYNIKNDKELIAIYNYFFPVLDFSIAYGITSSYDIWYDKDKERPKWFQLVLELLLLYDVLTDQGQLTYPDSSEQAERNRLKLILERQEVEKKLYDEIQNIIFNGFEKYTKMLNFEFHEDKNMFAMELRSQLTIK